MIADSLKCVWSTGKGLGWRQSGVSDQLVKESRNGVSEWDDQGKVCSSTGSTGTLGTGVATVCSYSSTIPHLLFPDDILIRFSHLSWHTGIWDAGPTLSADHLHRILPAMSRVRINKVAQLDWREGRMGEVSFSSRKGVRENITFWWPLVFTWNCQGEPISAV